jgi:uncharacterized protein YciI
VADGDTYLCLLRPARLGMVTEGPTAREAEIVSRHAVYLRSLAERDAVLLFGRTSRPGDERTFGIVLLRAESEEAARRLVADDPAVAQGAMRAELHPYRIANLRGGTP